MPSSATGRRSRHNACEWPCPEDRHRRESSGAIHPQYADYSGGGPTGEQKTLDVDLIIGAEGANSRVAKAMDAGDYNVAIAQERIKLPAEEMTYYKIWLRCMSAPTSP